MSTVIEFRSPLSRAMPRADGPVAAEIIIFPGVRRERHVEACAATPPAEPAPEPEAKPKRQSRGKPKRDRLELPE